ncbi:MAG TPA: CDP-alcohol phosphatidyltransferase family protein [Microlunatus sp.]
MSATEDHVTTETRSEGGPDVDDAEPPVGRSVRRVVATATAGLVVLAALLIPSAVNYPTPGLRLALPVEAMLAVAILLILPGGARRVVVPVIGVAFGLLTVLKIIDLGFYAALARPFDLLFDWSLFGNGFDFLRGSYGMVAAVLAVVVALVVACSVVVLLTWSVGLLSRTGAECAAVRPGIVAVTAALLAFNLVGGSILPGAPVGLTSMTVAYDRALQIRRGLDDHRAFAAELKLDQFAGVGRQELLAGLRGKDVVIAFVESYGRSAVEDPQLAPPVTSLLDAGDRRLRSAGFRSRSGFLTSSTAGGGSWLAHGTLLAGVWVDNEQRYRSLVQTDRMTLNHAFRRAGWRTVGISPGTTGDWPEGGFFGYDRLYDSRTLGYRGPNFSWATMPDQYTLAAFERLERAGTDRPSVMAEIQLVSSHAPWAPIPELIAWPAVGDGSVFDGMDTEDDPPSAILTRDPARVRADYRRSIAYSLGSLISYVETHGDDDLVLILLGDHQPNPVVTGDSASRDVPITIITRDPGVLERIAGWNWTPGLKPAPAAPVWRMDAFRDRFLGAFGPRSRSAGGPR